jgi:hypothetical protein
MPEVLADNSQGGDFRTVRHVSVPSESLFYKPFRQSQESWLRINGFLWQKRLIFPKFAANGKVSFFNY